MDIPGAADSEPPVKLGFGVLGVALDLRGSSFISRTLSTLRVSVLHVYMWIATSL